MEKEIAMEVDRIFSEIRLNSPNTIKWTARLSIVILK